MKAIGLGSTATAAACSSDPFLGTRWYQLNMPILMLLNQKRLSQVMPVTLQVFVTNVRKAVILAKNREGRVLNVEGNPAHPLHKEKFAFVVKLAFKKPILLTV